MYFLVSGEGPTDIGAGVGAGEICEGTDFQHGPLSLIMDQIVERHQRHNYSPLASACVGFVAEHRLTARAGELKASKKAMGLPGVKQPKETRYFFNNARVLARIANEAQAERPDENVIAILFRDTDKASAGRGDWEHKRRSMEHGFVEEGFARGVPMLAKPKSEAWIIAGRTGETSHQGTPLENWSGSDTSPHSLKAALTALLGVTPTREILSDLVRDGTVDYRRIALPAFRAFQDRFETLLA